MFCGISQKDSGEICIENYGEFSYAIHEIFSGINPCRNFVEDTEEHFLRIPGIISKKCPHTNFWRNVWENSEDILESFDGSLGEISKRISRVFDFLK